jgi:large subunit ribosomal protein L20
MARTKRGFKLRRRHKKILKLAKGYRGTRSKLYRVAAQVVAHSLVYAYRDRKVKKREFRQLWIQRINAAARLNGLRYGDFMNGLKRADIQVNRKVLAELAVSDAKVFGQYVEKARQALV